MSPVPPAAEALVPQDLQLPKIDSNKLHHIFKKPGRDLDSLVTDFGSQGSAFEAIRNATQEAIKKQNISGMYEIEIEVHGHKLTVRGTVMNDGTIKIGTVFP
jgi:hypothetical protein